MLLAASCVAAALAFAAGVQGGTPEGTQPSTTNGLWVKFGNQVITENQFVAKSGSSTTIKPRGMRVLLLIIPSSDTLRAPNIALNNSHITTASSILMVDVSLPLANLAQNRSSDPAPGLGQNRTTRLHWWSSNVTQASDGTLTIPASSDALIAPYNNPSPPPGDTPHTYVLYLLPGGFTEGQQYRQFFNASSSNRNNFNLPDLLSHSQTLGGPIAATYFQVQVCNATQTTCASASHTADCTSSTPTPSKTSAAVGSFVDNPTLWAVLAGVGAMAAFVV